MSVHPAHWLISTQAKEDGTFNAAVDDASNLDPAYREFQSCDGQHFFEPRRRAEFVTERPTGGQFTHEPGGILADEMGVRQCENPNSRRFFDTAEK